MKLALLLVLILCSVRCIEAGTCIADESSLGNNFNDADTWDCTNDTADDIPGVFDAAIIRNTTVILNDSSAAVVSSLLVEDAGGFQVLDDSHFETNWAQILLYSDVYVDTESTFDISPVNDNSSDCYLIISEGSEFYIDGIQDLNVHARPTGNAYIRVADSSVLTKTGTGNINIRSYIGEANFVDVSGGSHLIVENSLVLVAGLAYTTTGVHNGAETEVRVTNSYLHAGYNLLLRSGSGYLSGSSGQAYLYVYKSLVEANALTIVGGGAIGYVDPNPSSIISGDGGPAAVAVRYGDLSVYDYVYLLGGRGGPVTYSNTDSWTYARAGNGGGVEVAVSSGVFRFGGYLRATGGIGGFSYLPYYSAGELHGGPGGAVVISTVKSIFAAGGNVYVTGGDGGVSSTFGGPGGDAQVFFSTSLGLDLASDEGGGIFNDFFITGGNGGVSEVYFDTDPGFVGNTFLSGDGGSASLFLDCEFFTSTNLSIVGGSAGSVYLNGDYLSTYYIISRTSGGSATFRAQYSIVKQRGPLQVSGGNGGDLIRVERDGLSLDVVQYASDGGDARVELLETVALFESDFMVLGASGGDAYTFAMAGNGGYSYFYSTYCALVFEEGLQIISGDTGLGDWRPNVYVQAGKAYVSHRFSTVFVDGDFSVSAGDGGGAYDQYIVFYNQVEGNSGAGDGGFAAVTLVGTKHQINGNVNVQGGNGGFSQRYYDVSGTGGLAYLRATESYLMIIGDSHTLSIQAGSGASETGVSLSAGYGGYARFSAYGSSIIIEADEDVLIAGGHGGSRYYTYQFRRYPYGVLGGPASVFTSMSYLDIGGNLFVTGGVSGQSSVTNYYFAAATFVHLDGWNRVNGDMLVQGITGGSIYVAVYELFPDLTSASPGGAARVTIDNFGLEVGGSLIVQGGNGGDRIDYSNNLEYVTYSETGAGGNAHLYMGLRYASFLTVGGDLSLYGGYGGDAVNSLVNNTGFGGMAWLRVYYPQSIEIVGNLNVIGGHAGSMYGITPPYFCYKPIDGADLLDRGARQSKLPRGDVVDGDGGSNCFFVDIEGVGGYGGQAKIFYDHDTTNCPSRIISVGKHLNVIGGDGGVGLTGGNGGHAYAAHINFNVANSEGEIIGFLVAGGLGGQSYGTVENVYLNYQRRYQGGHGGEASLFNAEVNVTGDCMLSGGDGGNGRYSYSDGGYGGWALLELSADRFFIYGNLQAYGGDGGYGYYAGRGGSAELSAETSLLVIEDDISLTGGDGGGGVFSGLQGGESTLFVELSNIIATDLHLVAGNGGDSIYGYAGGFGQSLVSATSSNLDFSRGDVAVVSGVGGSCKYSDVNCRGGSFADPFFYSLGLFGSRMVTGSIYIFGGEGGDSGGNSDGLHEGGGCGMLLYSTALAVSGPVNMRGVDGGDGSGTGRGAMAYSCTFGMVTSTFIAQSLDIVIPSGGDSGTSSFAAAGGGISLSHSSLVSSARPYVVNLNYHSGMLLKDYLSISSGTTGSSATAPGHVRFNSFLQVQSASELFVKGDLSISAPDSGLLTNFGQGSDGGSAFVSVVTNSEMNVGGDFSLFAGDGTDRADGGDAYLFLGLGTVEIFGDTNIRGGDAGNNDGDGGFAKISSSSNSFIRLRDVALTGGEGEPEGSAVVDNNCGCEFVLLGQMVMGPQDADSIITQRVSTFTIYPCEDADLVMEGPNEHFFSSVFRDCRSDVDAGDIFYSTPTGDPQSDFDCTPCECTDITDFEEFCPEFLTPSPSPSSEPEPSSASFLSSSFVLSFLHLFF